MCSGCGLVAYCSKEHQRLHWKTHKATCQQKHKNPQSQTNSQTQAKSSNITASGTGGIQEVEVLVEDQKRINAFGRLNHRLSELSDEIKDSTLDVDNLKDAVDELEGLLDDNGLKFRIGEVFINMDSDQAESSTKSKLKNAKKHLKSLDAERTQITSEMQSLKSILYAKFGESINLET